MLFMKLRVMDESRSSAGRDGDMTDGDIGDGKKGFGFGVNNTGGRSESTESHAATPRMLSSPGENLDFSISPAERETSAIMTRKISEMAAVRSILPLTPSPS